MDWKVKRPPLFFWIFMFVEDCWISNERFSVLLFFPFSPFRLGYQSHPWDDSPKNQLIGLIAGCVPSLNSLDSLYLCLHKPVIYSKLLAVRKRLGFEAFPLVDQTYYSSWKSMNFSTGFPLVAKVKWTVPLFFFYVPKNKSQTNLKLLLLSQVWNHSRWFRENTYQ